MVGIALTEYYNQPHEVEARKFSENLFEKWEKFNVHKH